MTAMLALATALGLAVAGLCYLSLLESSARASPAASIACRPRAMVASGVMGLAAAGLAALVGLVVG